MQIRIKHGPCLSFAFKLDTNFKCTQALKFNFYTLFDVEPDSLGLPTHFDKQIKALIG